MRRSFYLLLCRGLLLAVGFALIVSCSSISSSLRDSPPHACAASGDDTIFARYAPVFVMEDYYKSYNRIGSAAAEKNAKGKERIFIDPADPTYYAMMQPFTTEKGAYTNLIYRVHFERVPLFHLTAGRNVGIFVVITLNEHEEPVLVTTVHTCGCYLAIIPTSYLPAEALPEDWDPLYQEVHGETLPGTLTYPDAFDCRYRPVVTLRHATHRVRDVRIENIEETGWRYTLVPARIMPMEALERLPLNGETTSFFDEEGWRKGYVKGSKKPLEMLWMSWWALDLNIGCDKALGDPEETGTKFYTSIKFWRRSVSNMWHFSRFLDYWGWGL